MASRFLFNYSQKLIQINLNPLNLLKRHLHSQISCIDNGFRIVSAHIDCPTATVGLWIDSGSKNETEANNGVANYLEHLLFKGTETRSEDDLQNEISELGSILESYVNRDEIAIYAKTFAESVPKVVEIIGDIVKNIKITDADLSKVCNEICNEIDNAPENDMERVVMDHLHSMAYMGTPLGFSTFGSSKNISCLKSDAFNNYILENFLPTNMVLASAGGFSHEQLINLACSTFGDLKIPPNIPLKEPTSTRYTGSEVRVRDDSIPYAYIAIAVESPGYKDPDFEALEIAREIIGSWDNTQIFGEHHASYLARTSCTENVCHFFKSFNIGYSDTGLWGIYFKCDPMRCDEMMIYVQTEWMKLCTMITDGDFERAKRTHVTNKLTKMGCKTQMCIEAATQGLRNCKALSVDKLRAKADSITLNDVKNACYKYIYDRCPVVCAVGPVENLPDYVRIRSSMYWLRV